MRALRPALAAIVVVVLGVSILGIGMGSAPKADPAPTGAALAKSKKAIADGGASVKRGREEFDAEHCGACHAIAATGDDGKLGPRMDAQGDPADEISTNITEPRKDIARGYEANLMPIDYAKRMSPREIKDVAAFVKAASAGAERHGPPGGGKRKDGDDG